ncbi:hypothetical protein CC2G_009879 [Coprinopsis cinerea AmutBmut pab1-1]|nr:hypothetical protein CC2G_009879 [Coprinopsis cinerea AmutBmut pab1-1]
MPLPRRPGGRPRRPVLGSTCALGFFVNLFAWLQVLGSVVVGAHGRAVNWTIPHNYPTIAYVPLGGWATLEAGFGGVTYKSTNAEFARARVIFRGQALYYESPLFFYEAHVVIDVDDTTSTELNLTQPDSATSGLPHDTPPISKATFLVAESLDPRKEHTITLRRPDRPVANITMGTFIYTTDDRPAREPNPESGRSDNRKLVIPLALVGSILFALIVFLLLLWAVKFPQYCCAPARRVIWKLTPSNRDHELGGVGGRDYRISSSGGRRKSFRGFGGNGGDAGGGGRGITMPRWLKSIPNPIKWFSTPPIQDHAPNRRFTNYDSSNHDAQRARNFEMGSTGGDGKGSGPGSANASVVLHDNGHGRESRAGVASYGNSGGVDPRASVASPILQARQLAIDLPYLQYLDSLASPPGEGDPRRDNPTMSPPLSTRHLAELNHQNSTSTSLRSDLLKNFQAAGTGSGKGSRSGGGKSREGGGQSREGGENVSEGGKSSVKPHAFGRTPTTSMQVTVTSGVDREEDTLVGDTSSIIRKLEEAAAKGLTSDSGGPRMFGDGMVASQPVPVKTLQSGPLMSASNKFKILQRKPLPQQPDATGPTTVMGPRENMSARHGQSHTRLPDSQSSMGHSSSEYGPLGSDSGHGHSAQPTSLTSHSANAGMGVRPLPVLAPKPSTPTRMHSVSMEKMQQEAVAELQRQHQQLEQQQQYSPPFGNARTRKESLGAGSVASGSGSHRGPPSNYGMPATESWGLGEGHGRKRHISMAPSTTSSITLAPPPNETMPSTWKGKGVDYGDGDGEYIPPVPGIPRPGAGTGRRPLPQVPPIPTSGGSKSPQLPTPPPTATGPRPPLPPPPPPQAQAQLQTHPPPPPEDDMNDDSMYTDYEGTWPPSPSTLQHYLNQSENSTIMNTILGVSNSSSSGNAAAGGSSLASKPSVRTVNSSSTNTHHTNPSASSSSSAYLQHTFEPVDDFGRPIKPPSASSNPRAATGKKPSYDPVWRPDGFGPRTAGGSDDGIARYTTGSSSGTTGSSKNRSAPHKRVEHLKGATGMRSLPHVDEHGYTKVT